ncbi:hypothetical protein CEUSTIGMA_g6643.t1 [Chlamydomonas eustigma]|uniref:Uncharacterized protein n=1 Tax=Chlamydomonas eustigma TaxID=1157962 RepID=A0A250X802_9CHLO|nr:hypothetical protein CEUSTIGMA_g6643.t1 [Chlamydomonas eustigma]|eukprot:GAX79203.1 hypothetical protein CEUSTIGMA_g6643.t1 [Chlamydomonas eustigma]
MMVGANASLLSDGVSRAESLLLNDYPHAESHIALVSTEGRTGSSKESSYEELAIHKNRVVWTTNGSLRKKFTLQSEVVQACLVDFPEGGDLDVVAVLQTTQLTTCTQGGQLYDTAMPGGLSIQSMWPCTAGVLLQATSNVATLLLTHPLEEPKPVLAELSLRSRRPGSYAGWSGERIVWSGRELPWVATYSEAASRLALWRIRTAVVPRGAAGNLPDLPAATPLQMQGGMPLLTPLSVGMMGAASAEPSPWIPSNPATTSATAASGHQELAGTLMSGAAAAAAAPRSCTPLSMTTTSAMSLSTPLGWQSKAKKLVARTPDGRLSPSMFNPKPRAGHLFPATLGGASTIHQPATSPGASPYDFVSNKGQQHVTPAEAAAAAADRMLTGLAGQDLSRHGIGGSGYGATAAALDPAVALYMGTPEVVFELAHERPLAAEELPSEGHLVTDHKGRPLLCVMLGAKGATNRKAMVLELFPLSSVEVATQPKINHTPMEYHNLQQSMPGTHSTPTGILLFTCPAKAAAAVTATRTPCCQTQVTSEQASVPAAAWGGGVRTPVPGSGLLVELLLLLPDGSLQLRQGIHIVCNIQLPMLHSAGRLLSWAKSPIRTVNKCERKPHIGSSTEQSQQTVADQQSEPAKEEEAVKMGEAALVVCVENMSESGDDDMDMESDYSGTPGIPSTSITNGPVPSIEKASHRTPSHTSHTSNVDQTFDGTPKQCITKAVHGTAPAQPSGVARILGLSHAFGSQVTVHVEGGKKARIDLPLGLSGSLPGACLAAMRVVLEEHTYFNVLRQLYRHPDACSPDQSKAWTAFTQTLLGCSSKVADQGSCGDVEPESATQSPTWHPPAAKSHVVPDAFGTPQMKRFAAMSLATALKDTSHRTPTLHAVKTDSMQSLGSPFAPPEVAAPTAPSASDPLFSLSFQVNAAIQQTPTQSGRPGWVKVGHTLDTGPWTVTQWLQQVTLPCVPALHEVYEDLKLDSNRWTQLRTLGCTLAACARVLGLPLYWEHYCRDLGPGCIAGVQDFLGEATGELLPCLADLSTSSLTACHIPPLSDLFRHLRFLLEGMLDGPALAVDAPKLLQHAPWLIPRTRTIIHCFTLLAGSVKRLSQLTADVNDTEGIGREACRKELNDLSIALALHLDQQGWSQKVLETLPLGVALPLREALHRLRPDPPSGWPITIYALIGREDMAATLLAAENKTHLPSHHLDTLPSALDGVERKECATAVSGLSQHESAVLNPVAGAPSSTPVTWDPAAAERALPLGRWLGEASGGDAVPLASGGDAIPLASGGDTVPLPAPGQHTATAIEESVFPGFFIPQIVGLGPSTNIRGDLNQPYAPEREQGNMVTRGGITACGVSIVEQAIGKGSAWRLEETRSRKGAHPWIPLSERSGSGRGAPQHQLLDLPAGSQGSWKAECDHSAVPRELGSWADKVYQSRYG